MDSRPCKKCIYHISGNCSQWKCEPMTLEEYKIKAIKEERKRIMDAMSNAVGYNPYQE